MGPRKSGSESAQKSMPPGPCGPQHSVVKLPQGTRCGPTHIAHAGSGRWHRFVPLLRQADPHPAGARCLHSPDRSGFAPGLDTLAAPEPGPVRTSNPAESHWQDDPDAEHPPPLASGRRRRPIIGRRLRSVPPSRLQMRRSWGRQPPRRQFPARNHGRSCPGASPPRSLPARHPNHRRLG